MTKSRRPSRAGVTRPLTSTGTDVPRPLVSVAALTNQTSSPKSVANVNKTSSSCSRRTMQFWQVLISVISQCFDFDVQIV